MPFSVSGGRPGHFDIRLVLVHIFANLDCPKSALWGQIQKDLENEMDELNKFDLSDKKEKNTISQKCIYIFSQDETSDDIFCWHDMQFSGIFA